jgi:hypothetical protein
VALIQNSLAVVIAVSGGRNSVRERILPHFVGSCSKAKKQALLATTTTSIARNAWKPPTESFRQNCKCKGERRCSHSSAAPRKELLILCPQQDRPVLGNPKVSCQWPLGRWPKKRFASYCITLPPPLVLEIRVSSFVFFVVFFLFSVKPCRWHKNGSSCKGWVMCESKVFFSVRTRNIVQFVLGRIYTCVETETLVRFSSNHRLSVLASSQASSIVCSFVYPFVLFDRNQLSSCCLELFFILSLLSGF